VDNIRDYEEGPLKRVKARDQQLQMLEKQVAAVRATLERLREESSDGEKRGWTVGLSTE
jgi:hypothetical protein